MKIKELIAYLETIAPSSLQEDYDNSGLIIGDRENTITSALICLDSTEAIVDEAIQKNCNLIIAHHPIIFSGLKQITGANYIQKTIIKAIKNDIAIYAIHTNLDNVLDSGVNTKFAEKLGLVNCRALVIKESNSHQDLHPGSGMIGELKTALSEELFLAHVKSKMKTPSIRHTKLLGRQVKTIAICGGSGSFLLPNAIEAAADFFVTGDFKYHQFFDANDKIVIADIGHFESEQFTIQLLYDIITKKFSNFAAHCTELNTNPIKYF
jgi:dinuclear metal center YbgI/SA1388 family protein